MFLCKVPHDSPEFSFWTLYTGTSGLGIDITTQGCCYHLAANLCLPWRPTFLTRTLSPTSSLLSLTL